MTFLKKLSHFAGFLHFLKEFLVLIHLTIYLLIKVYILLRFVTINF